MVNEPTHPESVSVEISGCSKDDARIVFDTLCACFSSDRCADDVPEELHETRPTVWLGTFDVADPREGRPAPRGCPPRSTPTYRAATGRSTASASRWRTCSASAT